MKNRKKFILFMASVLNLMFLSGVVVYAAATSELSLPLAVVLLLASGIAFGTLMYYGYDIDKE